MVDFDSMAEAREEYATTLSDLEIWRNIVLKIIKLEIENDMKVDILMQSISDIGTIFGQLKFYNTKGELTNKDYHDLLEICIAKYEQQKGIVDFNPLTYKED